MEKRAGHAVVVGNPVADEIRREGTLIGHAVGGTATYASLALRALGLDITLVGAMGHDHAAMLREPLVRAGVDVAGCRVVSDSSTSYLLDYQGEDRQVRLRSRGPRIEAAAMGLPPSGASFVHVGPVAGELDAAAILALGAWGIPMGIDLHALRTFDDQGRVRLVSGQESGLPFSRFAAVKGSLAELRAFAPQARSLLDCLAAVAAFGVETVLATDGSHGALVYAQGDLEFVPAYPVEEIDATGAGDVFLAGFLAGRYALGESPEDAARLGAAAASFVVQGPGASVLGTLEDIRSRRATLESRRLSDPERRRWDI